MFIGHFGIAFAAKPVARRSSLGLLIACALFLDLLWPVLLLTGVERVRIQPGDTAFTPLAFEHYPISHSLAASLLWAVAAGLLYFALRRYRTGAIAAGAAVFSHWTLDALVHRPDLPLYPGSDVFIGLGLWNSVPAAVAVEASFFLCCVWLYARATQAVDRRGRIGFHAFVVFLLLLYAANLAGGEPPGPQAVAAAGLATALFPAWAWWFDRHRTAVRKFQAQ